MSRTRQEGFQHNGYSKSHSNLDVSGTAIHCSRHTTVPLHGMLREPKKFGTFNKSLQEMLTLRMSWSSSARKGVWSILGFSWFSHRSRHDLALREVSTMLATNLQMVSQ